MFFAERSAVETHIAEVGSSVKDDIKVVGTGLVFNKAHGIKSFFLICLL
ncbi:hypothetical protein BACFIN_05167 [Bacteroides finegoldii DSM 17565]|jgi:hypothetical protein|nr:hypothetical protein BACFIN_05167 [Bacteroides finegoldii DSM 17565]